MLQVGINMAASLTNLVMLGHLLSFFVGGAADTCVTKQQTKNHIELCHEQPRPKEDGPYECDTPGEGFVLKDLKIAPRSKFSECGPFHVDGFLAARCLREQQQQRSQGGAASVEAAEFDVLDKVSGKSRIENDTVVDRMTFVEPAAPSSSSSSSSGKSDSSAFVSFKKMCKPVRPAVVEGQHNEVVRICSNDKATGSHVFLAFLGDDDNDDDDGDDLILPSDTPFRCRCTLRPSHTVSLQALDIRLQRSDSRACSSGISVKIHSGSRNERSQELPCQGLSAQYDFEKLYSSQDDVTLDLTVTAPRARPTFVWIQASEDGSRMRLDPIIVSCEGITLLDKAELIDDEDTGTNVGVIVGAVVAVAVLIAIAIIVVCVVKKRKQQKTDDTSDEEKWDGIPSSPAENVYAEPDEPRSSFRKEFDFPQKGEPQTPPPLPEGGPPGKTPPPKPSRTFSFEQDSGSRDAAGGRAEEYDCLLRDPSKKSKLRSEGDAEEKTGAKGDSRNSGSDRRRTADGYDHLELDETKKDLGK